MKSLQFKTGLLTFVGLIIALVMGDVDGGWFNTYNTMAITFFASAIVSIIWPSDAMIELSDGKIHVSRGTYTVTNFLLAAVACLVWMKDNPNIVDGIPHYILPEKLITVILAKIAIIMRLFTGKGTATSAR